MELSTDTLTLIATFIGGGGLYKLYSLFEEKRAKKLENDKTDIDNKSAMNKVYEDTISFLQKEVEYLKTSRHETHEKLDKRENEISELKAKIDELNSSVAILTRFKCTLIHCTNRKPPLDITDNSVG